MIRATTFLSKQLHDDIQRLAERVGKTPADVLRELVQRGLQSRHDDPKPIVPREAIAGGALLDLANLKITGGPRDLSTQADHYLYGEN